MKLPCLGRRIFEMIIVPVIVSLFFGILYKMGILPRTAMIMKIVMLLCMGLVIGIMVYMLRSYYFFVKNRLDYFTVNIIAYTVAIIVNFIVFFLCKQSIIPESIYETMYYVYNFFGVFCGIKLLPSTLFVHAIMFIVIFVAPMELYSVAEKEKNQSINE